MATALPFDDPTVGIVHRGHKDLLDLLLSQGRTDPRMFERGIADIQRGGQQYRGAIRGDFASRGLGQSGVGAALQAASLQGTEGRVAGARRQRASEEEQRRRDALETFYNLIVQPGLETEAIRQGALGRLQGIQGQSQAAMMAALAKLLGGINFGDFGGSSSGTPAYYGSEEDIA